MSTIYIIIASGRSYDDAWEQNLFAVTDEAKAMVAVDELKAQHEKVKIIYPTIYEFFRTHLHDSVSLFMHEPQPPHPKGCSKMTKEGQAEYHAACAKWVDEVRPITQRNQVRTAEHNTYTCAATCAFAATLGITDEELKSIGLDVEGTNWPNFDSDTNYTYENLDLR